MSNGAYTVFPQLPGGLCPISFFVLMGAYIFQYAPCFLNAPKDSNKE